MNDKIELTENLKNHLLKKLQPMIKILLVNHFLENGNNQNFLIKTKCNVLTEIIKELSKEQPVITREQLQFCNILYDETMNYL